MGHRKAWGQCSLREGPEDTGMHSCSLRDPRPEVRDLLSQCREKGLWPGDK